jgi:hypothetical protein
VRHLIKGLIAAVAVMAAAPAMACGYSACAQPPVYVAPVAAHAGCNPCGGWVRERLPDPEQQYHSEQQYYPGQQYYYVNQGPTYTGPGNWAPRPVYREGSISGYGYGYHRPYRAHYHRHQAARYYQGQRVLRRYY